MPQPKAKPQSKSKKIYVEIANHMKALIEQGQLKPGDKLPSMTELAAQFGASRATVREAFSSLVGMGLIDLRHGEGTFVQKIDVDTMITKPMNAALLLGMGDMKQLLEVRKLLEIGIIEYVCERATEAQLEKIVAAFTKIETAGPQLEEQVSADLQFHFALAQASGNDVLYNLLSTLSETLRSILRTVFAEVRDPQTVVAQHRGIMVAILARDKALAAQLMREHLERSEQLLTQVKTQTNPV